MAATHLSQWRDLQGEMAKLKRMFADLGHFSAPAAWR